MPLLRTLLLNATLGLAGYWSARHGFRMPPGVPRVLGRARSPGPGQRSAWRSWVPSGSCRSARCWPGPRPDASRACTSADRHGRREAAAGPRPRARDRPWEAAAILSLGLVLWVTLVHGLSSLMGPVKVVSDGPIYHLYFAARWWKAGRITLVAAPFGDVAVTYFPAVGDLWFAWLMIGWGGERLAKVGQLPFLAGRGGRGLRVRPATRRGGLGGGHRDLLVRDEPALPLLHAAAERRHDPRRELPRGDLFLPPVRAGRRRPGALILGALASGGVLGTKPTGIVFGALLLGTAALAVLVRRRPSAGCSATGSSSPCSPWSWPASGTDATSC